VGLPCFGAKAVFVAFVMFLFVLITAPSSIFFARTGRGRMRGCSVW